MVCWSPGLGLLATSTPPPLRAVEPLDRTALAVALTVDPDLAVVIDAGLEQQPRPPRVAAAHRLRHGERHAVPHERESGHIVAPEPGPRTRIGADLPPRVVVVGQAAGTAHGPLFQPIVVGPRNEPLGILPLSLDGRLSIGAVDVNRESRHEFLLAVL